MPAAQPRTAYDGWSKAMRPTREALHMTTAWSWARRSTCKQPQRQIGCIITSPTMDEILSFGYNGPSRSQPNDSCKLAEPGQSRCSCLHAEINALLRCRRDPTGAYLFVTMQPCFMCAQAIDNSRIARVYYLRDYREKTGVELLKHSGVEVVDFTANYAEIALH
jgi:dCMP deaminase